MNSIYDQYSLSVHLFLDGQLFDFIDALMKIAFFLGDHPHNEENKQEHKLALVRFEYPFEEGKDYESDS